MTGQEKQMLEALATDAGITVSDWIRLTIRREFAAFAAPKSKPKPKR
jgi:hypothetical protein